MRVVVLVADASTRESEVFIITVSQQLVIDELGAVVRVHPQQWKRQPAAREPNGRKHMDLGLVAHRDAFGPAGLHIREIKRQAIIAARITAIMADQVHFNKARLIFVPVRPGANRNLALE